ncbi:MAG: hypothetical protein ACREOW_12715 [Thermodesulfobacteriota bacterium]
MGDKERDKWDKSEIICKSVGAILTPLAIVGLGLIGNHILQKNQQREQRTQLYTQLMSQREESESGLRKDMFSSIINSFLKPGSAAFEEKVLKLELLAYNFHESLNLKPLFIHLKNQINSEKISKEEKRRYLDRLQKVAKEITNKQVYILEEVGQKFDMTIIFENTDQPKAQLEDVTKRKLTLNGIERTFEIEAIERDLEDKRIRIRLHVSSVYQQTPIVHDFWVDYFDLPTIDHIRLSNDQRCSVVLKVFKSYGAEITLLYFPGSYASLKEKPYVEEMLKKLTTDSLSSESP